MKIIVVESPNKAKTLSGFLNPDYEILTSRGHIFNLSVKNMGFDENFNPIFELNEAGKKLEQALKKLYSMDSKSCIYLATDADREGEGIAFHIQEVASRIGFSVFKRLLFKNFTKQAVLKSLENTVELDFNLVFSQQARRIADRFIGFAISKGLQRYISKHSGSGRVQAVALFLLTEQFLKFKNFQSNSYLALSGTHEEVKYDINILDKNLKNACLENNLKLVTDFMDQYKERIFEFSLLSRKKTKVSGLKLVPFKTITMQKSASKHFGFSPERTMQTAQALFEGKKINNTHVGLITYHRTDSVRVSDSAMSKITEQLSAMYPDVDFDFTSIVTIVDKQLNVQDAHECIRPTNLDVLPSSIEHELNSDEYKIYNLIYYNFIGSFFCVPVWERTTVSYKHKDILQLSQNSYVLESVGYLAEGNCFLFAPDYKHQNHSEILSMIVDVVVRKTTGPKPLSEMDLIEKLEENGVGRPSTYADIIPKIEEKKYILIYEKLVHVTRIGEFVNKELAEFFPKLVNLNFTMLFEQKLNQIAKDKNLYFEVLNEMYQDFNSYLQVFYKHTADIAAGTYFSDLKCIFCSSNAVIRKGPHGLFAACLKQHLYSADICGITSNFASCAVNENVVTLGLACSDCNKGKVILKIYKNQISTYCLGCMVSSEKVNRTEFVNLQYLYTEEKICPLFIEKTKEKSS